MGNRGEQLLFSWGQRYEQAHAESLRQPKAEPFHARAKRAAGLKHTVQRTQGKETESGSCQWHTLWKSRYLSLWSMLCVVDGRKS